MKETSSPNSRSTPRRANPRLLVLAIGFVALIGLSGCSPCEVRTVHGLYAAPQGIVAQVGSLDGGQWVDSHYLSQDGGETWEWTPPEDLGINTHDEEARGGFDETTSAEEPGSEPELSDAEANFVDGPASDTAGSEQSGGFGLEPGSDGKDDNDDVAAIPRTGPRLEPVRETEACLSNSRCFRTVPGEQIQEQINGRWETSFRFSDEELRRFEARDKTCNDGTSDALFGFLAVGGTAQAAEQADFVVVSMGNQGVLRLNGNVDEWERIAVSELEPISTFGPRWLSVLVISPLFALALTPVIFFTNRSRATQSRRATATIIHLVLTTCVILVCGFIWLVSFGELDYAFLGLAPFLGTLMVLGITFSIVLPKGRDPELGPPPPTGPPSPVEPPPVRR